MRTSLLLAVAVAMSAGSLATAQSIAPAARIARVGELRPAGIGLYAPLLARVQLTRAEAFSTHSASVALANRLAQAQPLAMATCDFDGDGMADVIAGWSTPDGNLLSVHRGNVDLLWPDTQAARQHRAEGLPVDAAFLPEVGVLDPGLRPELLGCGQFDGDGHPDLVVAARGASRLAFLFGDGRGGIARRLERELPGPTSALAVGEVNRRDGLDDVAVGIAAGTGAELLVLEGPDGAATATAESLDAPATVTTLVFGHLDDDWLPDLAAAAGFDVLLVHGRDRKLALDATRQGGVPRARIDRIATGASIESLTAVDLDGRGWPDLAAITIDGDLVLLDPRDPAAAPVKVGGIERSALRGASLMAAHSFGYPGADLVVVDRAGRRLLAVPADSLAAARQGEDARTSAIELDAEPMAMLPMRLDRDGLDDLVVLTAAAPGLSVVLASSRSTFVVDSGGFWPNICEFPTDADANPGDGICRSLGGGCTLPAAIGEANWSPAADTIVFQVQPNPNGCDEFGSQVSGGPLTVDGTSFPGLYLSHVVLQAAGGVLRGAEILDLDVYDQANGTLIEGNTLHASQIATSGNTIGGTVAPARNIVLGAIQISGGPAIDNDVQGNWFGTEDGVTSAGGGGLTVGGSIPVLGTLIGGTQTTMRNLFCDGGIALGDFAEGSLVQGNYIGTNVTGTASFGASTGVEIKAPGNTVGGTTLAARNLIAAGHTGVRVYDSAGRPENLIQGNLIGTDISGDLALGFDAAGIELTLASDVVIGGITLGAGNLISGNSPSTLQGAIWVRGPTAVNNLIQGNRIGTNANGTGALPNYRGIRISDADATIIGGTAGGSATGICTGACNVIGASSTEAVYVSSSSSGTVIVGNHIGADVVGTAGLSNQFGIRLDNAPATTIGGSDGVSPGGPCTGACNIIAAATSSGISIGNGSNGVLVAGNFIGTDASGASPLGNGGIGILVSASADTIIGGETAAARNVIAASGQMGIRLSGAATTGSVIRSNLIGLGADGETLMGNASYGISIATSAANNSIGGLDPAQGNTIVASTFTGIRAEATAGHGNAFLSNKIWNNTYYGIDIGAPGADINDPGDGDDGANGLQNYPVLTGVLYPPTGLSFSGSLDSTPSTTYRIQFFASRICGPFGHGEGEALLGTATIITGPDGHVGFNIPLAGAVAQGHQFTATATDPAGNTSEFSACLAGPAGIDISVRKIAPASVGAGDLIEFQIPVENIGNSLASNVTLTDTLHACLTEITCTTTRGTCQLIGSTATAVLGVLAPLDEALVTITARVGTACPVDLTNTATALTAGDFNPGNDSDTSHTRLDSVFTNGFETGD